VPLHIIGQITPLPSGWEEITRLITDLLRSAGLNESALLRYDYSELTDTP
jgi:hypothetical protein